MSLKTVFEPYFKIGAAAPLAAFENPAAMRYMKEQYHSLTCENDMKPEHLLDGKKMLADPEKYNLTPAVDFSKVRPVLDFAQENGLKMRGHTLVWHAQTPRWFFAEGYRIEEDAPLASREVMLARMESYICSVLTFVQEAYPDLIYAWDVVNEAIEENGLRRSLWYQTIGEDYILQAFTFARKYAAPGVSLFYNDYDTFSPWKQEKICSLVLEPLMEAGLVDGMGMQSHLTMDAPTPEGYRRALWNYGALGIQVQITELDIHNADPSEAYMHRLALRYQEFFRILTEAKKTGKANVTGVTFWCLQDEESWLSGFRKERSYPLLFHKNYKPKEAYEAVLRVPGLVEGDEPDRLAGGERFAFWEKEQHYRKELHVDQKHPQADDKNDGSMEHPLRTIQAAADRALPGTRVWIHGGVYRECVRPARGGDDADTMICYEAWNQEEVVIKASETAEQFTKSIGWDLRRDDAGRELSENIHIWETKIDPDKFRGYNPFCAVNILHDRLFIEYEKTDMTTYLNRRGMVFCDGKPLKQVALYYQMATEDNTYWVEANGQTIHFRLKDDENPADHIIELTCREQCFAPEKPFLSYIIVKGITCAHAATGAPVPQRGAISCFRGHHWIIENCKIDWSNGVGIDIGNECWHHTYCADQIIGHTVIRGCEIRDVGVCGIAGMFATHLLIEDNLISGTGWQKMELSWEAGGIKVHNCVDSLIRRNIFTKTLRADHLWMDVANENNRITGNLFLDGIEQREAIFIECSRDGINLIDNNIFWNVEGRFDPRDIPQEPGSTGWYKMEEHPVVNGYAVYGEGTDRLHIVHNLIGRCRGAGYFAKPVSFRITSAGRGGTSREAKIYNNIFYECGEAAIKFPTRENEAQGNLYVKMPGGYLRVLYPAPEVCLDLAAWQEFYGFDKKGQEGWFEMEVDTENLTLRCEKANTALQISPRVCGKAEYLTAPEQVMAVEQEMEVLTDFMGIWTEGKRIPGPIAGLTGGVWYSIDPRKKRI